MPVFPKPTFPFAFNVQQEIGNLRAWKAHRQIPAKQADRLLVVTWNIANFGAQDRRDEPHRFDVWEPCGRECDLADLLQQPPPHVD